MATTTKKDAAVKMTPAQIKRELERLQMENDKLKDSIRCVYCDTLKKKDDFYVSTDPDNKTGRTMICKNCCRRIALRIDANGEEHSSTRDSLCKTLEIMNKPFLESLWSSSIQESENLAAGKVKSDPALAYFKNIQMGQYIGLTYYKDSDMFKEKVIYEDEKTEKQIVEEHAGLDTYDDFIKNKEDVKRLLSYDPFEAEAPSDQPILYANLLGLLDQGGDQNDDMMRTASCVTIVRGFLQASKLDNTISQLMGDYKNIEKNSATIRSLQDSKNKIMNTITNLAAESCISLKNNKNAKKGENTWTGKIKKIKDLDLREGRVNGFDIETSKAMRQVMDNSHRSILQELKLDESDWSDMVAEQRTMIVDLQNQLDKYVEISRILLTENLDLKDFIKDKNIDTEGYSYVNLEELYSCFSAYEDEDQEEETESEEFTDENV